MSDIKNLIAEKTKAIENKKLEIKEKQKEINSFEFSCSDSDFDSFLDEVYENINICNTEYSASYALKCVDRTAYDVAKSDYESNYDLNNCKEYKDLESELEDLESELEDLESELEDLESELD